MKTYAHRAPAVLVSLVLLVAAALNLPAQITAANDPANLAGERVSPQDPADTLPINHGAPALEQLLRKLRTRASFMLIVAHPDDEDNGGLTYLSRGKGARVATLTLNRGEGGQNLMSADFEDALGLIRTQELLAADRYMGVDQFFGTEIDFGFSKTKEEAFGKWTHERVLYDAVRVIRLYRPLIIASVFIGEPSDGHGQHQVSGEIAQEAFKAAGDPSVFPDQIASGLQPWQPLKVYARSPFGRIDAQGMYDYATAQYVPAKFTNYVTGKVTSTVPKANVVIPEGDTDPLLDGKSYAQFGREGRSLQKSQIGGGGGGGRGGPGGRVDVSYHRYGSKLNQPDGDDSGLESSFFDGIDTSVEGIATLSPHLPMSFMHGLKDLSKSISDASSVFEATHSPQSKDNQRAHNLLAEPLVNALKETDALIAGIDTSKLPAEEKYNLRHELQIKRVQLNNALILALGINLTAEVPTAEAHSLTIANPKVVVKATMFSLSSLFAPRLSLQLSGSEIASSGPEDPLAHMPAGVPSEGTLTAELKAPQHPTRPYFSRPDIEQPYYDIADPTVRNAPATPAPLVVHAQVEYEGTRLLLDAAVTTSGQGQQPVVFVPPVSVSLNRSAAILRPGEKSVQAVATVSAEDAIQTLGGVKVLLRPDPKTKPELLETAGPQEYQKEIGKPEQIGISVDTNKIWGKAPTLTAEVSLQGRDYSEGFRSLGYPGLAYTNYYTPATMHVVPVDVHTAPDLNVAYLPGTGDDVPAALDQLGVKTHTLTAADLTVEALKPYDAVILGVRAYDHANLAPANPALNAYAAAGGVVIAQYNTGRLPENTGPYPLSLGGAEKVVEEDAPVKLVAADNPLLTWPNKITTADFDGWVEERGHSFMESWDPHYTALLETHDHGQQPQLGGLLVARTGKGAWIYLGLALYRQLPEGVPGSYRLLANLISTAKNPRFNTPTP